MYGVVLFIHSWLRYAVLGAGLWLLLACVRGLRGGGPWAPSDERAHIAFLALLDTQLLLGLTLYFALSPISAAAMANFHTAMKNPPLRFFGVEHIATMLLAIIAAHIGRVRAKRKQGSARYQRTLVAHVLWLVLTLAAIPWPGLDIGRPLFRF